MLNSLTARSLCEIALRQITLRLLPKLTREEVEGEKRRPSLRGVSVQHQAQESYEGLELTSFSPTRVPLKWLQVGWRCPSSTSLVLNGAKKKKTLMTRGGQCLLSPFTALPGSCHPNVAHVLLSSLPVFPLVLWLSARCCYSLRFHNDGNYREKEA